MRIASEGYPFIFGLGAAVFACFLIGHTVGNAAGWILLAAAFFCIFFFRDPPRNPAQDPRYIISPGDGRVMEVTEENHPLFTGKVRVIRIFLSIFNVHVQHSPIAGKVSFIEYRKGKFLDARNPRAAHENENNSILIENGQVKVLVKQVAGLIARRISCQVKMGQQVQVGQKLGLIRFGSQVDVYLPLDLEVCVAPGDRVVSGVSMIAMNKKILGK
ncbi:MAG: phosphatidylserine decarboxylase [Elusimicrobia bacterium RIFCSPLOWO2_01_FULL_54_10]|nr:MAG: phosphatidylserine decarboxylase [Elusimicrobia bacterium RIFCSPLOWO2_01_FULL_54_10]